VKTPKSKSVGEKKYQTPMAEGAAERGSLGGRRRVYHLAICEQVFGMDEPGAQVQSTKKNLSWGKQ